MLRNDVRTTDERDRDSARHHEIMELLRTINERVAALEEWVRRTEERAYHRAPDGFLVPTPPNDGRDWVWSWEEFRHVPPPVTPAAYREVPDLVPASRELRPGDEMRYGAPGG